MKAAGNLEIACIASWGVKKTSASDNTETTRKPRESAAVSQVMFPDAAVAFTRNRVAIEATCSTNHVPNRNFPHGATSLVLGVRSGLTPSALPREPLGHVSEARNGL